MCGIVGIASQTRVNDRQALITMRDTMVHRGPDDAGVWWSSDEQVGLAHRRLAILDLSAAGQQPMSDATHHFHLTFNGEIYNHEEVRRELEARGHVFRTRTDTEVLLEAYSAWGAQCLDRLDGMYAFALYDDLARRLFIARDRAGEKPLYYDASGGRIVFASELKALMSSPTVSREVDLEALNHYLTYGYVPNAKCILKGVRKLPPAHAMTYDVADGETDIWPYWQLPDPGTGEECSEEQLVEALDGLLFNSVRDRMVADVPVGILLSGGVDSSLITALAARASSKPVRTFTISFPGQGAFDEAPYARLVSEHFGTEHTELAAEDFSADILPRLVHQYDEPNADSSLIPTYLVSRLIREHATVALGGDGGDELFGGYRHYQRLQLFDRLRGLDLGNVGSATAQGLAHLLPIGMKGRTYLFGLNGSAAHAIAHVDMFFDAAARRSLVSDGVWREMAQSDTPENAKKAICDPAQSTLQQATKADFSTYLAEDILAKVDRASMLTSLEVRAPWLDHRVIEFAFSQVPDHLKATERELKILPKRLARRLLPQSLDLDRKQGFSIPLNTWLRGALGRLVDELLDASDPRLFNPQALNRLRQVQRRGLGNGKRLFAIAMFELWRREYRVTVPTDEPLMGSA